MRNIYILLKLFINKKSKWLEYLYEKGGVYYGGDYLEEPPEEVYIDSADSK